MKKISLIIATIFVLLGCTSNPKKEFVKEVAAFSNYDSINWDATIENHYDIFDWNKEAMDQFYANTSVWLRYIRQDYREELMKDTYNQVMTPAISELIRELTQE